MNVEQLTASIAQRDPLLANAVSQMVGYIQDKWAAIRIMPRDSMPRIVLG